MRLHKRLLALAILLFASPACSDPSSSKPRDGLPPDPGANGRVTIPGIDSDQDSLRDDVQRYIYQTYSDKPTRDALAQTARPQLRSLVVADDKAEVLNLTEDMIRGVECLYHVRNAQEAEQILADLEPVMLNTRARIEASIRADRQAGGETFTLSDGAPDQSCVTR